MSTDLQPTILSCQSNKKGHILINRTYATWLQKPKEIDIFKKLSWAHHIVSLYLQVIVILEVIDPLNYSNLLTVIVAN